MDNPAFDGKPTQTQHGADGDGEPSPESEGPDDESDSETALATGDGDGDEPACDSGLELCGNLCADTLNDPNHCGDCNIVCDPGFYCDLGSCELDGRAVFVTSGMYTAAFMGGLDGAHSICINHAMAADLGDNFLAWIGDGPNSPANTFSTEGRFVRTDGMPIAESWADLTDGTLLNPISIDENGNPSEHTNSCPIDEGVAVWSSLDIAGQNSGDNCLAWTSLDGDFAGVGYLDATDSEWTTAVNCVADCGVSLPIYCFEQ